MIGINEVGTDIWIMTSKACNTSLGHNITTECNMHDSQIYTHDMTCKHSSSIPEVVRLKTLSASFIAFQVCLRCSLHVVVVGESVIQ